VRVTVQRFEQFGSMRFQLTGPVGIITINRPRQRNALTRGMWETLAQWCEHLPQKTKVLILRGGGRDFTAGSDIKEFARLTVDEADDAFETMERAIAAMERVQVPTIASINGPAYGAGFVLALACDLRIGSPLARFGMPVGKLGITLQTPFVRRLIAILGPSRTKELVYTARSYSAEEALALGLLNQLVPEEELDERTLDLAKSILQQSRASLFAVKDSVHRVLAGEAERERHWVDRRDFVEGVRAFTEKRPARF
jgi:enoyl-CoA hydratase